MSTPERTLFSGTLRHRIVPMTGRDPDEEGRTATTLELLFDLTFAIAFASASSALAHLLSEGHFVTGAIAFSASVFAIVWAWINFTWFASAYDTDDWVFRVATGIQMLGVLILTMGIPASFASVDAHRHFDNSVMVLGYVVMRVAMIFQWLRAARQDHARRANCVRYASWISIAQIGWVIMIFIDVTLWWSLAIMAVLVCVEMLGPYLGERMAGGTPWHPHHIAERYGLLFLITLGECLVGTVASLSAIVSEQGWTVNAALVGFAGTALAFGLWWSYFILPAGNSLHHNRGVAFLFGYGHIVVFGSIAAIGAGLHLAAYYVEHQAHIPVWQVVGATAVPVGIYVAVMAYIYGRMEPFDPILIALLAIKLTLTALAVILAAVHVPLVICLLMLAAVPFVTVVADELFLHRRRAQSYL